ncbi:rps10b (nucleomorph) [Hemiselmis andersenii]|uniref:Rps10b n=2 Tax=Hemiselmis andersenii TaxID=464988 RepID=A9BKS3_HEMAN|nr:rps10b [Hemiselmis andersenii]ABW98078.1 rps10b [Hemiselmis andersenii]|mmetsp:Transcript_7964/g.18442  ORF Transcript_7964/g.18442 Transcript_7964/m.18442 type:complete len:97 (+) Transcript_7964:35-325(+)
MIIKKKDKKLIYTQLFKDGLLVVKKEKKFFLEKEKQIESIIVIKLLKSLVSKGFVKESFCWKYYYFILNDRGIEFLRNYLQIPSDVIPLTLPLVLK